jgi:N-acyl homoserine lactone hydrolase
MINKLLLLSMGVVASLFALTLSYAKPVNTRLYILNCGYIDFRDFSSFSDTNFYPHGPMRLAAPCFLIKDPKGWMLWDLGLGDQYINHPHQDNNLGVVFTVPISLIDQLKQIGLTPSDIKFVGISHAHLDHVGNLNLFPNATFIMQRAEYKYIQKKPVPIGILDSTYTFLKEKHKILLNGDYDVFGDGAVKALSTPGHTPGHQSLEVILPHKGTVILSGDLYHTRQAYVHKLIPTFNTNRTETLTSMARVDKILQDTHGQLIIQHDPNDFAALPKAPQYLN